MRVHRACLALAVALWAEGRTYRQWPSTQYQPFW